MAALLSAPGCFLLRDDLEELRNAPLEARLDGRTYTLDADLWRDFMPPTPTNGRPLAVVLRVIAEDGEEVPADLEILQAWVLHEDQAWSGILDVEDVEPGDDFLEATMQNGPKWGPDVLVDVVARIRVDSVSALLRVADQNVERVQ